MTFDTNVDKDAIYDKLDEWIKTLRNTLKKDVAPDLRKFVNDEVLYPLYMETYIEYIDCALADVAFGIAMKYLHEVRNKDLILEKLDFYMKILSTTIDSGPIYGVERYPFTQDDWDNIFKNTKNIS